MNLSIKRQFTLVLISILASLVFCVQPVNASSTNGSIDSTNRYVWSENTGWLDFKADGSDVTITDSVLTGYIWSENLGWISLNCSNESSCATVDYKVSNNGAGTLSGYAWSENAGWIHFNPSESGVVINSSGIFTGYAWSETTGWISFNCSNTSSCGTVDFKLSTDYRPPSGRAACNNLSDDDGDGLIDYPSDPGCDSASDTDETDAVVNGGGGAPGSVGGGINLPVPRLQTISPDGTVTYLDTPSPSEEVSVVAPVADAIKEVVSMIKPSDMVVGLLPDSIAKFFKPEVEDTEKLEPEKLVTEDAPLSLSGGWNLLPSKAIERFALSPLPKELIVLTEKFPELGDIFDELGVKKGSDIDKLKNVKLTMPGLTKSAGLETANLQSNGFVLPAGIPVGELSIDAKKKLPTEVIFAKTGGQLIDLHNIITVSERGDVQQRVNITAGKTLDLAVKPEAPVESVKGYLILSPKTELSNNQSVLSLFSLPLDSLLGSVIFSTSALAQNHKPIEKKFVLAEFSYFDENNDGIYTATIQTPVVEGKYEVLTVLKYKDIRIGDKEIRLITVIDPEGYVYEKIGNKEARIPGATASIYWKNPETDDFVLWPAKEYLQKNPQVTNQTGKYSFLVPEGSYFLKIEALGYKDYESDEFWTEEGDGIHINIEMKKERLFGRVTRWLKKLFGK